MKSIFFLAAICSLNSLFGQQLRKLNVREVKEASIIDSVLDKNIFKSKPDRSCILLDVGSGYYMYHLYINSIKTDLSIIDLYKYDLNNNLRFFRYKGYLVFVLGTSNYYQFFLKTSKRRLFIFKNNTTTKTQKDGNPRNDNVVNLNMYRYQEGVFVTILREMD